jgi:hypothetical protein
LFGRETAISQLVPEVPRLQGFCIRGDSRLTPGKAGYTFRGTLPCALPDCENKDERKGKSITQKTRMMTMEEKMKMQLADEALDDIVGGAFNQDAVSRLGLDVKTGKSGTQGLTVKLTYRESDGTSHSGGFVQQTLTENTLRKYVDKPGELTVAVKTTSGEWKDLTRSEFNELFS